MASSSIAVASSHKANKKTKQYPTTTTIHTNTLRHSYDNDDDDDDNDTISPRSFRNQISCIFPSPSSNSSTSRPTLSQQRKQQDRTIRSGRKKNNSDYEAAAVVVNDNDDDRFQIDDDDDDGHDNDNRSRDDNLTQSNGSPSKTQAKRRGRRKHKVQGNEEEGQHASSCTCCGCCRCCQHLHLCQIFYLLINDRSNLKIALLRLLPSMLVMKAFWLSVASIYICDLANIVDIQFVNNDNSFVLNQQPHSQHLGIVNVRSFGLFSYSKNPLPDRNSNRNHPYYYNQQQQQQEEETALDFMNVTTSTAITGSFWNETSEALETLGEDIEDFVEEELGTCHSLQENGHFFFPLDKPFHVARVCGVSTILLGLISVTIIWIHTCQSVSKRTWYYTQFVVLVCCCLEGMTLMIFHTNICSGQPYELASLTLAGQHDLNLKASADMTSSSGDVSSTTEHEQSPSPPSSLQIQCQCELAGGSEAVIVATLFWFITFISMKCVPSNLEYTWAMEYSAAHLASDEQELQFHHEEYELAASGSNFQKGSSVTKRHHLYQVDEGNEDQGDDDDDDRSTGSENSFNYDNDDDHNNQQSNKRYLKIV